MILLDGLDKHDDTHAPKLVAEASTSYAVARPTTPTPSLPDYEASQEASQSQLQPTTLSYPELQQKRTRRRRCRLYTIYALVIYFVLTVVIGIPILVVKLKPKISKSSSPYQSWQDNSPPPSPPKSVNLGNTPLLISDAISCNTWNVKDRPDGSMFVSELDYSVPGTASMFLDTNITYSTNTSYLNQFAGTLLVAVNDDPSESDGVVQVTMHHSTQELANSTNVCLMEANGGHGLYIFAPKNLSLVDALIFNITLLLPQNNTSPRHIPSLLCHLPHFQHTYQQLDPQITFDSVTFGGAMAGVYVESLQAAEAIVMASSAEVRGTFKVTKHLSLETVSAAMNVDAHLSYDPSTPGPTFMYLTTGNSVLNANVTLYVPPGNATDSDDDSNNHWHHQGPQFVAHTETFNAPLNVEVVHDTGSMPANIQLRAINNLGTSRLTLDSLYAGTFDVSTMFAQADVMTWHGDEAYDSDGDDDGSDDDGSTDGASKRSALSDGDGSPTPVKRTIRSLLPALASTTTTSADASASSGRCLEYDLISSSEIRGWVGIPPRPSSNYYQHDNQSHVSVVSSLNLAQLVLQP